MNESVIGGFPVQIQADNTDAETSDPTAMCHVFDYVGQSALFAALCKSYLHVIAWDRNGHQIATYDNRQGD